MTKNGRIIKGSIDDGTGGSINQLSCVKEKRDHSLFGRGCVFSPVCEAVGLFFAASVGTGSGHGFAEVVDEL